ncbi:hypothetical protein [Nocardioides sp. AN3]
MKRIAAVRAVLGAILLLAPRRAAAVANGAPPDAVLCWAARLLGGRYLLQAATAATLPRRWVAVGEPAVELTHLCSMVALAARCPRRRRAAVFSGLIAAGFTAADVRAAVVLARESGR